MTREEYNILCGYSEVRQSCGNCKHKRAHSASRGIYICHLLSDVNDYPFSDEVALNAACSRWEAK